jgi:hypothetical protein
MVRARRETDKITTTNFITSFFEKLKDFTSGV